MAYSDDDAQRELASSIYGANKDMQSPLYQLLLKQTLQQGQNGNYGIGNAIAQALGTVFMSGGGQKASWSPGLVNDSYSMGGGD